MSTPSTNNVVFGRGAILFDRFTAAGVRQGQFVHLGNCDNFATSVATDKVTMTDYTSQTSAPYATANKSTTVTLKIEGFEIDTKILAMLFMGDTTTYTQALTTVTTETIAATTLTGLKGSYFTSSLRNVSAGTMLWGTTTLVSGTDWELFNTYGGVFHVFPTSPTVVDGTVLKVNYTAAALTAGSTALDVIRAFNTASIIGRLLFVPNNTTGPNNEVVVWNCSFTPDGDIPLISDEFLKWNLVGTAQSDTAGTYGGSSTNPFMQITKRS
jgi:hypothetical protein